MRFALTKWQGGWMMRKHMIPNNERPTKEQQEFIIKAIDRLGFEPFNKPIHIYTLDEFKKIGEMYQEVNLPSG